MSVSDASSITPQRQATGFFSVLTGMQRGACAPLIEGVDYVVGADNDCDLVVWDDSVAPRHLLLRWHGEHLRIEALDAVVVLADQVLAAGAAFECAPGLILRLGEICVGVGDKQQDWSQAVCPEAPAVGSEQGAETDGAVDTSDVADTATAPPSAMATPADTGARSEFDGQHNQNPQRTSRTVWMPVAAILGALLLATLLINGGWLTSQESLNGVDDPAVLMPDPRTRAQTVLEQFSLDDVVLTERADGVLVLTGYCESRELKDRITQALSAAAVRADNRLWPEDGVRAVLAQTLERIGGERIAHEYHGRGVVHLSGYLPRNLTKEPFLRLLHQDVAGLARVEGEVHAIADLIADLQRRAREAELPHKLLKFSTEGQAIRVAGRLNAVDVPRWEAIVSAFKQAHQNSAPLDVAIKWGAVKSTPTPAAAPSAPAWQSSRRVLGVLIGLDQTAFALLDDGRRVSAGDRIDAHYMVEEIQFDRVIALGDGERRIFYVGVE